LGIRRYYFIIFFLIIGFIIPGILSSVEAQVIISIDKPDGIVYQQDEKIFIVQHTGYSMLVGTEDLPYAADSIIYGDIVNVSDDTVYYIIIRGNVYKDGELWEKTGYGQKWTFRHNYSPEFGNPTELAISPFKMTLRPGEAAPFSLWPGQSGWDCYEVWIEGYEFENPEENISEEILRNDVVITSGKLDDRGTYKGKVYNPTDKSITYAYVILVKYDHNNEIFAILGDDLGSLSAGKSQSFTIPVFIPGYQVKSHVENFLYGKPHHVEVLTWGYEDDRTQSKTSFGYPGDLLLWSSSMYYPEEPRPQHMNFEEIKEQATQDADKSPITDFCTKPKQKEEVTISSDVSVPNWIKNNARWWGNNEITDQNFVTSIQYLINQRIIKLDTPEPTEDTRYQSGIPTPLTQDIPDWVKNNAKWWSENKISTNDFVAGLKYLIEQGIIRV